MDHQNDLPLMSNTKDIAVHHYVLDLACDFDSRRFLGHVTLFLVSKNSEAGNSQIFSIKEYQPNPTKVPVKDTTNYSSHGDTDFELVLDCCDLEITNVEEIVANGKVDNNILDNPANQNGPPNSEVYKSCKTAEKLTLQYSVEKWCVRIRKDGIKSSQLFPRIIRITYNTTNKGASLRWVHDQENNPCVFSAAMWINNRALMPCQEYGNLSTWEAYIRAPADAQVITTADHNAVCQLTENGAKEWYYSCRMPLPSFTLALAVGYWQESAILTNNKPEEIPGFPEVTCGHVPRCRVTYSEQWNIPCRIFAPESVLTRAAHQFTTYFPKCCQELQRLLGAYPFQRMDIVIYPPSCQDMALSNPNQIFFSQSVLSADGSMNIKLAHEMCHAWFGLLIGAKDWTEEWLSEGFATFLEDHVHAATMNWCEEEARERGELRATLRYKVLAAEMTNTQEDLQLLRPNKGETPEEDGNVMYVKNGLNANKLFTQVHYLKGYFLLRYLCGITGPSVFMNAIKDFIIMYHGCMVLSQDFMKFIFEACPSLSEAGLTISTLYEDWLDCSGMPKVLENLKICANNSLYNQVIEETGKWVAIEKQNSTKRKSTKRKKRISMNELKKDLESDQLVLLLEELLEMQKLSHCTLGLLYDTYDLGQRNADVRHRWCELVVKHRYSKHYNDIEQFLTNDQAMGVYLYGEMVISRSKELRQLAQKCFLKVEAEMEAGTRTMVHTMLHGSDS